MKDVSDELYDLLKSYSDVLGVSLQRRNGMDYIIIYLAKATKSLLSKIPSEYRGVKVKTEVRGGFFLH